jgi:hypothetical protein
MMLHFDVNYVRERILYEENADDIDSGLFISTSELGILSGGAFNDLYTKDVQASSRQRAYPH